MRLLPVTGLRLTMINNILSWLGQHPYIVALVLILLFGMAVSAMYFGVDLTPYVEALKWW